MTGSVTTSQAIQPELVNLLQLRRVLPVILYDIDVIGGCEEAGEGGGTGVPQWRGHDALSTSVSLGGCKQIPRLHSPF